MANAHEADRSGVTVAEAVGGLFAQLPVSGKDVVWLADQVIAIAQHLGSVSLERIPAGDAHALDCRTDSTHQIIAGRDPLRLFRPLLARFAVLGADETGGEPHLYGGRYVLVRSSRTGPVRLEVAFTNTPESQHLTITRIPAGVAPRIGCAPDSGTANVAPQPSA